jgi:hypothetical protein
MRAEPRRPKEARARLHQISGRQFGLSSLARQPPSVDASELEDQPPERRDMPARERSEDEP